MANFGQMLAAAQAYATPEQERKRAQTQSQGAEYEVKKEKKSQMDELQALMEAEMKKASESSGPFGALGDIGKLISFIPGIGTGVGAGMQALSGMGQAKGQKDALKKLMKDPKFAKYKGTYLGDPTKQYLKDVEGLAGDIDPLKTGLTSLATSLASGKIAKGIGEKFKGAFKPSEAVFSPGTGGVSQQLTTPDITKSFGGGGGGVGFDVDLLKEGFTGGVKDFGFTQAQFAPSGLKGLFKDFDLMDILGEGMEGQENLQALPLLMQMFGGGGQGMDFSAGSYFGK